MMRRSVARARAGPPVAGGPRVVAVMRLLLTSAAVLAATAVVAAPAQADPLVTSECHKFVYCTVYGPDGQQVVSVEEILDAVKPQ